jgi:hypothetical protein
VDEVASIHSMAERVLEAVRSPVADDINTTHCPRDPPETHCPANFWLMTAPNAGIGPSRQPTGDSPSKGAICSRTSRNCPSARSSR